MIYQFAYRRMIDQSKDVDYAAFRQFYEVVEQDLNGAADKINELQRDYSDVLQCLDDESNGITSDYATYILYLKLRSISSNSLSDLFLYLPGSDKIVSGYNAALSPEYYFGTYYSGSYDKSLFVQYDTSYKLIPLTTGSGQQTLALRMPVFSPAPYPVICVLHAGYLQERIGALQESIQGDLLIIDRDGQTLLSSSPGETPDLSSAALKKGVQEITLDGVSYCAFVQPSSLVSCRYVALVPVSSMYQSLSLFQFSTMINMILYGLFGVLLAFLLAKYNYRPVRHLLQSVTPLSSQAAHAEAPAPEEFQYIESIIENAIVEKKQYLSDLADIQQMRRGNLVKNLIHGSVPTDGPAESTFAEFGESLLSERFAVMLFCIEEWNDAVFSLNYADERPMLAQIIFPNVIEEICAEKNRGFVINTDPDHFVCLINPADETTEEDLTSIAERARGFLEEKMGISCTVGIGNIYSSLQDVRLSYNEARRAEEYKLIFGIGTVLSYRSFSARKGVTYNFIPGETTRITLLQCIKNGDEDPLAVFDRIYASSFGGKLPQTPEAARSFVLDLCMQMNEVLNELDAQGSSLFAEHQFDLNVETYQSIDEFREYFVRRIREISREYLEHHTVKSLGRSIREFIDQNYANVNLGVNEIGEQFDLSAAYCSKIYKQEMNQSIPEYISSVRVSHACKQLTETTDSLEQIARQCGFTSSAVFIRSFKKVYGVTPGSYRKVMQ